MRINEQCGFSLLEMVIALLIGSILLLSITTFYPHLVKYAINSYRQFRLEQVLYQATHSLEKDLSRAGFMLPIGEEGVIMSTYDSIPFCIIIYYSYTRNHYWQLTTSNRDRFAYRLKNGQLAHKRGSSDCTSHDWERLIDPTEINITEFSVIKHNNPLSKAVYFTIRLAAHWQGFPAIHHQLIRTVIGENM